MSSDDVLQGIILGCSFFPARPVISRRLVNATLGERGDLVIDKASFDAFLYRTMS